MSDHQLMIYIMLRLTYTKLELKKWQCKNFSKESFLKDLKLGFSNDGIFNHFNNEFNEILDYHVHIKQTKLSRNTKNHVNKTL